MFLLPTFYYFSLNLFNSDDLFRQFSLTGFWCCQVFRCHRRQHELSDDHKTWYMEQLALVHRRTLFPFPYICSHFPEAILTHHGLLLDSQKAKTSHRSPRSSLPYLPQELSVLFLFQGRGFILPSWPKHPFLTTQPCLSLAASQLHPHCLQSPFRIS